MTVYAKKRYSLVLTCIYSFNWSTPYHVKQHTYTMPITLHDNHKLFKQALVLATEFGQCV